MSFYVVYCLQGGDVKVAELVGVNQAHLQKLVQRGQGRHTSESDVEKERICKRFFMALLLNDVIQEVCIVPMQSQKTHHVMFLFVCLVLCMAQLLMTVMNETTDRQTALQQKQSCSCVTRLAVAQIYAVVMKHSMLYLVLSSMARMATKG